MDTSTPHSQSSSPAKEPVKDTDLILRSLRSKRLEGWTQRSDSRPSFETRARGALLRMRSEIYSEPRKRATQYSEVLVMETKSRSVLDTPRSRSMTASARNEATKQSMRRHSGMNLTGSAEPLDRADFAARGLDARDGLAGVFDCRGHVMRVGVDDGVGVAHDGDMAFPEHQIAAPQFLRFRRIQCPAKAVLLHVAVARAAYACGVQRDLHQPGAVDAKTALAAPQIWRAGELFGHRDEIVHVAVDAADMLARQIPAAASHGENAIVADHRDGRPHDKRIDRQQFDRGPRKRECAQCHDLVCRRRGGLGQRAIGKPADITVAVQLAPRKTFAIAVINRDAFAHQRLRQQHGIAGRRAAQWRDGIRYLERLAGDKAPGLDPAFEIFRGEVGSRRGQPRIIHNVRSAVCRSRARPGIRLPRAAPASPMASSRRYRDAASSLRPRRNAAGTRRRRWSRRTRPTARC